MVIANHMLKGLQTLTSALPRYALSRLVQGVTVAAGLILVAWWATQWTAPRPVAALPGNLAGREAPADPRDALRVLGLASDAGVADGLRLTGIYAATDGGGFATFVTPKGPVQVLVGKEVAAGILLQEVGENHVVLSVGGVRRQVPLRDEAAGLASLRSPPVDTRSNP